MSPKHKQITKGKDGVKKEVSVVNSKVQQVEVLDEGKKRKFEIARAKALKTKVVQKAHKQTAVGMGAVGVSTNDLEKKFLNEWLDERPHLIAFTASMARNGLIEASFAGEQQRGFDQKVGVRVFADGATKYKSMRTTCALSFLKELVAPAMAFHFQGEHRRPLDLARRIVLKILGVDENTSKVPAGHKFAAYYIPLLVLFKAAIKDLDFSFLKGYTAAQLDAWCDWFKIAADGNSVVCLVMDKEVAIDCHVDFAKATDWVVSNPDKYYEASLISEDLGVDMLLFKPFEKKNARPKVDAEYHFDASNPLPGMPALPDASPIKTAPSGDWSLVDAFCCSVTFSASHQDAIVITGTSSLVNQIGGVTQYFCSAACVVASRSLFGLHGQLLPMLPSSVLVDN